MGDFSNGEILHRRGSEWFFTVYISYSLAKSHKTDVMFMF